MKKKTDTLKQLLTIIAFAVMLAGSAAAEDKTAAAIARGECEIRIMTAMLRPGQLGVTPDNMDAVFSVAVTLCARLRVFNYAAREEYEADVLAKSVWQRAEE